MTGESVKAGQKYKAWYMRKPLLPTDFLFIIKLRKYATSNEQRLWTDKYSLIRLDI